MKLKQSYEEMMMDLVDDLGYDGEYRDSEVKYKVTGKNDP
jgi:hypothetical protein